MLLYTRTALILHNLLAVEINSDNIILGSYFFGFIGISRCRPNAFYNAVSFCFTAG